tara:strand:- start:432 stop:2339 length:1908 start_codon:yes stop_codon:yes gene_type:complete
MSTRHIILCGGTGYRLRGEALFEKPLCLVLGRPLIQHVLESIQSDVVTLIASNHLKKYQFDTTINHLTDKKVEFIYLDRHTRGPVETAFLGLSKSSEIKDDDRLIFYDNDTIYEGIDLPSEYVNSIGYLKVPDPTLSYPYCFLNIENNLVKGIHEKSQVSESYAAGVYMFESKEFFIKAAKPLLKELEIGELYMSTLLNDILQNSNKKIHAFKIKSGICLGTKEDIINNLDRIEFKKLRLCFDLDNTILKYRLPGETYGDCKPIKEAVNLVTKLHQMGHTIIIHTARGMATASQNNGSALCRVGKDTFDVLEKLNIPFDEIYFGKPSADIYIDDKAHNPFLNLIKSIGFPQLEVPKLNPTNKYNSILIDGNNVIKTGPKDSMKGEVFFYKNVSKVDIKKYYPKYIKSSSTPVTTKLELETIHGFELYKLLKDELLDINHLDKIVSAFDEIHSTQTTINIEPTDLYENYMGKLKKRIENTSEYPFEDSSYLISIIDPIIKDYLFSSEMKIAGFIHGDPWFSNTMLDLKSNIKFLDMKGDIAGKLTTNGDPLTDYSKIMQSLYGFDYIINEDDFDEDYLISLRRYFVDRIKNKGYQEKHINSITACLIAKTISFFESGSPHKKSIWNLAIKLARQLK